MNIALLKSDTQEIVVDEVFPHTPETIWKTLTNGALIGRWLMEATGGSFTPNLEVDELRWVPLDEAYRLLTYPRDRELVAILGAAEQVEPLL